MALSVIDFISPKITLYYNGHNSHKSQIGGLLSFFLFVLFSVLFLYIIWDYILFPKIRSSIINEQNINSKIYQPIDFLGINHFLQIYSNKDNGWFGDFDKKNIIIYSIKENQTYSFNNLNINLSNIEHWLYDKCEKIFDINKNLFSEISHIIPNYSKSICLRYYYNPNTKEYYEIGYNGFVSPNLETNEISEKKNIYKIIIEKCINNTFVNKKIGYFCNKENEINNYLNIYSEIFAYFSNNHIIPINYKSPFKKFFYSVSSSIYKNAYFENNIIFAPLKIITEKIFIHKNKEESSYILENHYLNNIKIDDEKKIIGIFNLYLKNNIIIYQRKYFNFLDAFAHIGGLVKILFFIFKILNYFNNRFIILEHMVDIFNISTGIDTNINYSDGNDFFLEKKHMTNHNFKIKVFNNNNIINAEDINHKMLKHYYTKTQDNKKKLKNYKEYSDKNNFSFLYNNLHKKNETFLSKRSQTKYLNHINEIPMGRQIILKNKEGKRKSYLSQGYLLHRKENSVISKNNSIYENDLSNNEIISNNDRSFMNNTNLFDIKEEIAICDSNRMENEINIKNKKEKKKLKIKKNNPKVEKYDNISYIIMKNLDNNGRHKSVNLTNQRKLFENNNSLNNKFGFLSKNSSGFINESSKQNLLNNSKLPFMIHNNKANEKKNDNYSRIPTFINNNDMFTNNITNAINNSNIDPSNFLKNIIQSRLKFYIDKKQNVNNFGKRIKYRDFIKSLFVFSNKYENKLWLLKKFRKKLLSEEHLYRAFINLYLIQKIFQIDESHKFDINELYNNL